MAWGNGGGQSAAADDLDAVVAGLYRLALVEFVAARDRLVRRLRVAGDTPAAPRLAALRRPTVSIWAANQLAHAAPTRWSCRPPPQSPPSRRRGQTEESIDRLDHMIVELRRHVFALDSDQSNPPRSSGGQE